MLLMAPNLLLWAIVFSVVALPESSCYSFSWTAVRLPTGLIGMGQLSNSRQYHRHHRQPSNLCMPSKLCMSTKLDTDNSAVQVAIDKFISTLQTSLDNDTFLSYTLKGPSMPRKRRKKNNNNKDNFDLEQQKEKLRGKYMTISGRLVLLKDKKKKKSKKVSKNENDTNASKGTLYVQTTIKYHLATDVAKNWKVDEQSAYNSDKTEVEVGLSQLFSTSMGNEVNAPLSEWGAQNVNGELGIVSGELITSDSIHKLQLQPSHKASFRLSKKKDANASSQQVNDMSALSHDRPKNVPLSPSSEFFQKLGVSNKDGKPLNGMASKLRQCQKFVEIVGTLIDNDISSDTSSPPSKIRTIDMGCGRGYLTFSLHSYLYNKFEADKDEPASISTQGIDRRPKLISEINGIAQSLGEEFKQLKFIEGTIGNTHNSLFGNDKDDNSLDILIALHACDTATDDALWCAISEDADIIVTAPCCQHELRPQIDKHTSNNPNHPLSEVLRHAIYRERATETVTDAMRAILLEIAGYQTSCFEFVGGEHTAKNVMITAQKNKKKRSDVEQEMWLQDRRRKLIELARLHGVERQRLAFLMGESILFDEETDSKSKTVHKNLSGMAPL